MMPRRSPRARILAVLLAGACLLGADFGRPDPATITLGKTTEQEIRARFGQPGGQGVTQVGERLVTTLRYTYAEPRSAAVPVRTMTYSFHEGRLVGFDYVSSFEADRTGFDETAVKQIKRGESTRAQVLALVGKPTGQYIYPSPYATIPGRHTDTYSSLHNEKLPPGNTIETTARLLTVTFDQRDVVLETNLVTTTSRKPLMVSPGAMHPLPGGLS
jgi:hypothetical protein